MPDSPQNQIASRFEARIEKIETELAHLQHDFDAQNEVILGNNRKLIEIENSIKEIVRRLEILSQPPEQPRTLEDDKPPHY